MRVPYLVSGTNEYGCSNLGRGSATVALRLARKLLREGYMTPGVTGLWQVLGRNDIPFDEMTKLDYLYVTNWSLWWDLKILCQTIPVVLGRRGAY